MNVYLVFADIPFEGSRFEGVFSTREKAQEYINSQDYYRWDDYRIQEEEVME